MNLDMSFFGKFPFFTEFLQKDALLSAVRKNSRIMTCLKKFGKQKSKYFQTALKTPNDPRVVPKDLQQHGFTPNNSVNTRMIQINIAILRGHHWSKVCENSFLELPATHPIRTKHPKLQRNSLVWEEIITTTLLHELVHFANNDAGIVPPPTEEWGFAFERCARLNTPMVPFSEIEELDFWASHNTIEKPLFPMKMPRRI